jgi:hypothetical protein
MKWVRLLFEDPTSPCLVRSTVAISHRFSWNLELFLPLVSRRCLHAASKGSHLRDGSFAHGGWHLPYFDETSEGGPGYVEAGGFLLGPHVRESRGLLGQTLLNRSRSAEPLNNEPQVRGFSNTHRTARVTELDGAHRTSSKPCASQSRRTAQTSTSSECWTHAHTDQARPRRRIPANDRPTDRKQRQTALSRRPRPQNRFGWSTAGGD